MIGIAIKDYFLPLQLRRGFEHNVNLIHHRYWLLLIVN
jgi:hypothetical protein